MSAGHKTWNTENVSDVASAIAYGVVGSNYNVTLADWRMSRPAEYGRREIASVVAADVVVGVAQFRLHANDDTKLNFPMTRAAQHVYCVVSYYTCTCVFVFTRHAIISHPTKSGRTIPAPSFIVRQSGSPFDVPRTRCVSVSTFPNVCFCWHPAHSMAPLPLAAPHRFIMFVYTHTVVDFCATRV